MNSVNSATLGWKERYIYILYIYISVLYIAQCPIYSSILYNNYSTVLHERFNSLSVTDRVPIHQRIGSSQGAFTLEVNPLCKVGLYRGAYAANFLGFN